jgi:hypothetical protein
MSIPSAVCGKRCGDSGCRFTWITLKNSAPGYNGDEYKREIYGGDQTTGKANLCRIAPLRLLILASKVIT